MPEKEEQDNKDTRNDAKKYAQYTGMAFQMIAIIGIFTYAGYKIDESANHTTKWVTALFSLTGVFVSLYLVIRSVKN